MRSIHLDYAATLSLPIYYILYIIILKRLAVVCKLINDPFEQIKIQTDFCE